jgi:IclR-like helix-turn-helix domain-containing protein
MRWDSRRAGYRLRSQHRDAGACHRVGSKRHPFVIPLTRVTGSVAVMDHLWDEIDAAVLECLASGDAGPAQIGERLGMSEAAASSVLAMLVMEGKVRICRASLQESVPR